MKRFLIIVLLSNCAWLAHAAALELADQQKVQGTQEVQEEGHVDRIRTTINNWVKIGQLPTDIKVTFRNSTTGSIIKSKKIRRTSLERLNAGTIGSEKVDLPIVPLTVTVSYKTYHNGEQKEIELGSFNISVEDLSKVKTILTLEITEDGYTKLVYPILDCTNKSL